jgi:peroxiredoxin Q/BCP
MQDPAPHRRETRARCALPRAASGLSFADMSSPARFVVAALSLSSLVLAAACSRDAPKSDPGVTTTVASGSPASSAATTMVTNGEVTVGKPPPDFTAKDQNGKDLTLSSLKGKPAVVYFYPKDETSGCTAEAKSFRDTWKDLEKTGVTVIGISTDTLDSHKAFATHHGLPFHLVSDESGTIAKSFGVPNHAGFLARQTFVIGADGNVKKIYRDVDVSKHVSEVLADLKS